MKKRSKKAPPGSQQRIVRPRFLDMSPNAQRKMLDIWCASDGVLKEQLLEAFGSGYAEGWDARVNDKLTDGEQPPMTPKLKPD